MIQRKSGEQEIETLAAAGGDGITLAEANTRALAFAALSGRFEVCIKPGLISIRPIAS